VKMALAVVRTVPILARERSMSKGEEELESLGEETTDSVQVTEVSEGRTDLGGLLAYLDELRQRDGQLLEATYIANKWQWHGFLTFEHHGFVISTSTGEWLSLDFGRNGITWDTFDDYPDYPDETFLVMRYSVNCENHLRLLQQYCKDTQPFNFFYNDCKTWSDGLRQLLKMELIADSPEELIKVMQRSKEEQQRASKFKLFGYVQCL